MFLPVTGQVFLTHGSQFADRVCAAASQDDRLFRALLRASKYGGYLGLASIASTISIAVMVDTGTIKPDSLIARRIAEEVAAVHGSSRSEPNGQNPQAPVGGGYVPSWPNS